MKTYLILISANAEWREVKDFYPTVSLENSPYGEYFQISEENRSVIFFHGGWGKISAAASSQYGITTFEPDYVLNLGTCGGFSGAINRGEIILAEKTIVYDIYEQMGDPDEAIQFYAVSMPHPEFDKKTPIPVQKTVLISADRDLLIDEVSMLKEKFNAVAGDWESGAIAWVCKTNHVPCLILRGVSDLVDTDGGEAYGKFDIFESGTAYVMKTLLDSLPSWLKEIQILTGGNFNIQ